MIKNYIMYFKDEVMKQDVEQYWLIPRVQNLGRRIYVLIIMLSLMFTHIYLFGFSSSYYCYLGVLFFGAIFAIMAQINNYYFNNFYISVSYRVLHIHTMMYLAIQLSYLKALNSDLSPIFSHVPNETVFFGLVIPILFASWLVVGFFLSIPFKILSFAFESMGDDFYVKNREVEYFITVDEADVIGFDNEYDTYSESQLQALRDIAARQGDYKLAAKIRDLISRKFPED